MTTHDTNHLLTDLFDQLNLERDELVGYVRNGSYLYGTNTPQSDVDYIVVVSRDAESRHIFLNNREIDITVHSAKTWARLLQSGSFIAVDAHLSGLMVWNESNPWAPLIKMSRWSDYDYLAATKGMLSSLGKIIVNEKRDDVRAKRLKLYVRTELILERYMNDPLNFSPRFSPEEVNDFYSTLPDVSACLYQQLLNNEKDE